MSNIRKENSKKDGLYIVEIVDISAKEMQYFIMGHSGRVYETRITNKPTCTCPDYKYRGKRCKHIYFVLIRAMNVNKGNEDKKKFTDFEISTMFKKMHKVMNNLYIDDVKSEKYKKAKKTKKDDNGLVNMKPLDDLCPVCLDDLTNGDDIDYCKYSCGKPIHTDCYKMWITKNSSICLFCKSEWFCDDEKKDAGDEYINLLV